MYIKGLTEYDKNGNEVKTCCIFGKATRDGEVKESNNGKQFATTSVKAFSKKDGSAEFVTVKAWSGPFLRAVGNTMKGDTMMACGRLNERTYEGKTYVDLVVDYYVCCPASETTKANFDELVGKVNAAFGSDEDNSELPF